MRETIAERDGVKEIDLMKLVMAYLQKWWLILACGLAGACIALIFTMNFITPMYRAGVSIYVNNARNNQPVDYVTSGNLDASQKLVNTYMNIAQSDRVLELVSARLNGTYTARDLREMLTAAQVDKTEIFKLYISGPDPEETARIANAMAEIAPKEISDLVEGSSARIIDYAKVPDQRYTPSYSKNTMLGGLIGCVLAVAYLTVMSLLDVRIKDDEDLRELFEIPILGRIPSIETVGDANRKEYSCGTEPAALVKRGKRSSRQQESIREERRCILTHESDFFMREAYKTLRTNVTFSLAGEGKSRVIMVTSPLQGEGKSTTAVNLALSFAEAGRKVLLIDCDMRRPMLGWLLDLSAPVGLSNLLLDPSLLEKSILERYSTIDILLPGDIPPNPSELLGAERMRTLLEQLREKYDCIILDTPPINIVTDASVLAPRTDGVLLVVRASHSERGAVIRAVEQLEYAQVKLLGFVLNGVDLEKCGYGYSKYRYGKYRCPGDPYGYYRGHDCAYNDGSPHGQKQAAEQVEQ